MLNLVVFGGGAGGCEGVFCRLAVDTGKNHMTGPLGPVLLSQHVNDIVSLTRAEFRGGCQRSWLSSVRGWVVWPPPATVLSGL